MSLDIVLTVTFTILSHSRLCRGIETELACSEKLRYCRNSIPPDRLNQLIRCLSAKLYRVRELLGSFKLSELSPAVERGDRAGGRPGEGWLRRVRLALLWTVIGIRRTSGVTKTLRTATCRSLLLLLLLLSLLLLLLLQRPPIVSA